jgi:hypothetical protein
MKSEPIALARGLSHSIVVSQAIFSFLAGGMGRNDNFRAGRVAGTLNITVVDRLWCKSSGSDRIHASEAAMLRVVLEIVQSAA